MIINKDFITRIDVNTNFVALADGSELIVTEDSMKSLLFGNKYREGLLDAETKRM